ncbi:unnamed protein product [Cladocopium goreaui]|uniref:Ubiquitin-like domain-containing protein n=1 Tax=Cladocopium goreaui TaxID=2562237 RepID=A0A9P1FVH9_9DINO|nr:unnamed protein product [Cladocopium goreaui]
MASQPTFHIHLISGLEFEVQPSGTLVKDLKEQISKVRGIPLYDQTLVVDGNELQNFDKVDPEGSVLLVIGASQVKNLVRDYMLNIQGRRPYRPIWGRLPETETKALVPDCLQGVRHMFQAWPEFRRPFFTEEEVEDYLTRSASCKMALQSESQRNAQFTDPYEQEMLGLQEGDIPMKVLLDYKERSWNHITTLSVEDAQRISQERDRLVQDPLDQHVLSSWDSCVRAVRTWHGCSAAHSEEGRHSLETSDPPWLVLAIDCHAVGVALMGRSRSPGAAWQAVTATGGPWWKARSSTLEKMEREMLWTASGWQQVMVNDLKLDLDHKKCAFLILEPVMGVASATRRKEISKSLNELGVAAIGFASSLTMLAAGAGAGARAGPPGRSGMCIDAGPNSAIFAPVFEGFLLTDAMIQIDLAAGTAGEEALARTLEQSLARCPIDARRRVRRNIMVYGEDSRNPRWQRLGEGRTFEADIIYLGISYAIRNTMYRHAIFATPGQYLGTETDDVNSNI